MQSTLYLVFFLSGFCALIYEVAWVRVLAFSLGNTAQATGCVLAVFMGGLAIGALIAGRIIDKDKSSLLFKYGLVECGIALAGILVTLLIDNSPQIYGQLCRLMPANIFWLSVLRLTLSSILLLLPTILMGATLPLLVSFCADRYLQAGKFFSRLYGFNTLGAVVGALFATFLGFAYIGINATVWTAAAVNLMIGLLACLMQSRLSADISMPPLAVPYTDIAIDAGSESVDSTAMAVDLKLLYLIAGLSGFTALAYEVLWTRLLRFYMTSITYAFTAMVAVFLLGLALGSFIYQRFMAGKKLSFAEQMQSFARVQYRSAFACAVSLVILPLSVLIKNKIFPAAANMLEDPLISIVSQALVTVAAILPAAIFIGISFPMVGAIAASRGKNLGSAVGTVYGANTIGCVLGSLTAGMILVTTVGTYKGFALIVALSVVTGMLASAAVIIGASQRRIKIVGTAALALASLAVFTLSPPYKMQVSSADEKLLKFSEDQTGSVCVIDYPKTGSTLLAVNGASYALTILPCKRYMRLLGHLPVLLHPHPQTALNICFGTGTTAGSVAIQPEIKSLDIVDLSPEVLKSARFFSRSNHNVLDNPKVHAQVNDGRNFLLCTDKKYDILTFEPPPPVESGVVNLYTREFYALAKNRLNPGGIICQWVPLHEQSMILWKMLVQAARAEFPYVSIWEPSTGEALILASTAPIVLDFDSLNARLSQDKEVKSSLEEVGLGSAPSLLSCYAIGGTDLDKFIAGVQPVTDDKPALEFFAPYCGTLPYAWELVEASSGLQSAMKHGPSSAADASLAPYLEAMHLQRFAYKDSATMSDALNKAAALLPANTWYQYLKDKAWVLLNAYSGSSQRSLPSGS